MAVDGCLDLVPLSFRLGGFLDFRIVYPVIGGIAVSLLLVLVFLLVFFVGLVCLVVFFGLVCLGFFIHAYGGCQHFLLPGVVAQDDLRFVFYAAEGLEN